MQFIVDTVDYFQKYPSVLISLTLFCLYLFYYLTKVVKHPNVICQDENFREFLYTHCPIMQEKFWPTFWCFESRAQTILRSVIKSSPKIQYESEILKTPDGGQIRLDWVENQNDLYPDPDTRPTVLLLPGLTGTSKESYALHYVEEARQLGCRVVVFNNRGNGAQLLTARTYCAANTEDLAFVVSHVKSKHPNSPTMGTGISLGGMILMQYVAREGQKSGLIAAMCVSMAWDVFDSSESLEAPGLNKHVINRALTVGLVNNLKENLHLFQDRIENIDHVLQSKTIREFDDRFTAPMFGYKSWEHYYKDACIHDKVHGLEVPVLCLNAADDPFSPKHAIPLIEAEKHKNIAIVVTSHGGHIGFMEGFFPRHKGYMDRLFSQYVEAIFKHGYKHLKQE